MQNYIHVWFCLLVVVGGGDWRWRSGCSGQPGLLSLTPLSSPPQYSAPTQISHAFPVQPSQHSQLPQLHNPFPVRRCEKKSCELRAVPSCLTFNKVPLFTPCFPGCSSGRGWTEADYTARNSLWFSTAFCPHSKGENFGLIKSEKSLYFRYLPIPKSD